MSTVPTGIRGNEGLVAKFTLGATTTEFDGDIKAFNIESENKDDSDLTFLEAASGDSKDYTVKVTALQSTEATSFWRYLWDNPGEEFTVVYGPHGNAVASASQPHFLMTLKADGKPPIGGEAKRGKDRYSFDYEFEVTAGPTLDDGA
jgi:hypothetical protein